MGITSCIPKAADNAAYRDLRDSEIRRYRTLGLNTDRTAALPDGFGLHVSKHRQGTKLTSRVHSASALVLLLHVQRRGPLMHMLGALRVTAHRIVTPVQALRLRPASVY